MDVRKNRNQGGSQEGGRVKANLGIEPGGLEHGSDIGRWVNQKRKQKYEVEGTVETDICVQILLNLQCGCILINPS